MSADDLSVIEATIGLLPRPLVRDADPIAEALRHQGHRSISTGLRTVQVDGLLYDLDSEAQAVISRWLSGEQPQIVTVRLVRHRIGGQT